MTRCQLALAAALVVLAAGRLDAQRLDSTLSARLRAPELQSPVAPKEPSRSDVFLRSAVLGTVGSAIGMAAGLSLGRGAASDSSKRGRVALFVVFSIPSTAVGTHLGARWAGAPGGGIGRRLLASTVGALAGLMAAASIGLNTSSDWGAATGYAIAQGVVSAALSR
jgi:hypothetical protein